MHIQGSLTVTIKRGGETWRRSSVLINFNGKSITINPSSCSTCYSCGCGHAVPPRDVDVDNAHDSDAIHADHDVDENCNVGALIQFDRRHAT